MICTHSYVHTLTLAHYKNTHELTVMYIDTHIHAHTHIRALQKNSCIYTHAHTVMRCTLKYTCTDAHYQSMHADFRRERDAHTHKHTHTHIYTQQENNGPRSEAPLNTHTHTHTQDMPRNAVHISLKKRFGISNVPAFSTTNRVVKISAYDEGSGFKLQF